MIDSLNHSLSENLVHAAVSVRCARRSLSQFCPSVTMLRHAQTVQPKYFRTVYNIVSLCYSLIRSRLLLHSQTV